MTYPELNEARRHWRWQPPSDCLAGQVVLVTGAGDGIGRAAAKTFALHGAHVVLLGRTRSKLEAVFDWIEAHTDTQPVIVPMDLEQMNDDSADALYNAISDTYGRLDGILHNASLLGPKVPIAHYPTHEWQRVIMVNSTAPFILTKSLLSLLDARPRAAVVFTASGVARKGRAYWGAYAVSKFAQEGLMETLADELAQTSSIVTASINPGGTRTSMRAAAYPAENPDTVPMPETHMDLYLYLFAEAPKTLHGLPINARDWTGPAS